MQPTDPSKFTDKAWEAIVKSQEVARRFSQQQLEVEHLIISLLEQQGLANTILTKAGVDVARLFQQLEAFTKRQAKVECRTIIFRTWLRFIFRCRGCHPHFLAR